MKETYFVITNHDGEAHIDHITKDELLSNLNEDYYGEDAEFVTDVHIRPCDMWLDNELLIIKGTVVVPEPSGYKVE